MIQLFHQVSNECSRITTRRYSTSFSSAIKLLHKDLHQPIYNIYGFVRFADEIVDTFHQHDKAKLLQDFQKETWLALEQGISLNPILHSFQQTMHTYKIPAELVTAFFQSMEMDLTGKNYTTESYQQYIYGSAEVVGLMCLYVFCNGDAALLECLKPSARALGAAFQKVNFLRDVKADYEGLNRTYFPEVDFRNFSRMDKKQIEADIAADFKMAFDGILHLPLKARFGVYVAYKYYYSLFKKIKRSQPSRILSGRIRISNYAKAFIILRAGLRSQLNIL